MTTPPNKALLGARGERIAQAAYQKRGFKIIATNFRNKRGKQIGEIDFVASKDDLLVFVEVKTRTTELSKYGSIYQAISPAKIRSTLKIIKWFNYMHGLSDQYRMRIDICFIIAKNLDKTSFSVNIITNAVTE